METQSLQEIFNGKQFRIPDYQRGYSWEIDQLLELIEDLESTKKDRHHYTGTLVIKKIKGDRVEAYGEYFTLYELIDGQQRLTTLLIFLNLIANELKSLGDSELNNTGNDIIKLYIKKQGNQNHIYKLVLDEQNNYYFQNAIIENQFKEPKTKSNKLLKSARDYIQKYLTTKKTTGEYPDFLKTLYIKITQSLSFTIYDAEDDAEVGVIFESLNDRGKPLSKLEIIKNFFIYQSDKIAQNEESKREIIHKLNYGWHEILTILSEIDLTKNEDENQFLTTSYILKFYSTIKEEKDISGKKISINSQLADTHKLIKKYFRSIEGDKGQSYKELERYIDDLGRMVNTMKKLYLPEHADFSNIKFNETQNTIKEKMLNSFKFKISLFNRLEVQASLRPLLIAIYENYSECEELSELLTLCEILAFRIYCIANDPSYTGLPTLRKLANEVYNKELSYEKLSIRLKEIIEEYCPYNEIEQKLLNIDDFYEWDGLKYFFYALEEEPTSGLELQEPPKYLWEEIEKVDKKKSIEHILPQNIIRTDGSVVKYWTDRFPDDKSHEKNLNRLGNLTLTYSNSNLGNKGYDEKREIYRGSNWQIQKDIANTYDNWTEDEIDSREKTLIEFAKKRWTFKGEDDFINSVKNKDLIEKELILFEGNKNVVMIYNDIKRFITDFPDVVIYPMKKNIRIRLNKHKKSENFIELERDEDKLVLRLLANNKIIDPEFEYYPHDTSWGRIRLNSTVDFEKIKTWLKIAYDNAIM